MDRLTIADLLGLCDALGISLGTCDDGALRIDCVDIEPQQRACLEANEVLILTAVDYGVRLTRFATTQACRPSYTGTRSRTLGATRLRVLEMPARDPPVQRPRRFDRNPLTAAVTYAEDIP